MGAQRGRSRGGQPVRAAPVMALDAFDHALRLEPGQRFIQRAGREPDPGEGLDVLGEGVAMLGAVGQAREDQRGRPRVPAEPGELLAVLGHDVHLISAPDLTAGAVRIRYGTRRARNTRGNASRSRHSPASTTKCAITAPRYAPNTSRTAGAPPCRCEVTARTAPPISATLPSTARRSARPASPGPPAATRLTSSRYCMPCAIVIPPTAAYGDAKTKTGTGKNSPIRYMTQKPRGGCAGARRASRITPAATAPAITAAESGNSAPNLGSTRSCSSAGRAISAQMPARPDAIKARRSAARSGGAPAVFAAGVSVAAAAAPAMISSTGARMKRHGWLTA